MTNSDERQWFAACPKGLEELLSRELTELGAGSARQSVAGVYFTGPLAVGYRACLWSRLANRILMPISSFDADTAQALYDGLFAISWGALFTPEQTFAVDFSGENDEIRNTLFGAQRSKDAIVDWFSRHNGERPSVEKRNPDIRVNVRLSKSKAVAALDFSGGSLHRRGYRLKAGEAPLKENLAAALLIRANWPEMAARGEALIDPMCGSGTLLIEAAMMAADIAPGLQREQFGFEHWTEHNIDQWQVLLSEARGRAERGVERDLPAIRGYDSNVEVVRIAQENIARAKLSKQVRVKARALSEFAKPSHEPMPTGLLICNPPYGERLGDKEKLLPLYRLLGETLARELPGWQCAIFTSDLDLGKAIGLRAHKRYALFNGALPSHLLLIDLQGNTFKDSSKTASTAVGEGGGEELSSGAQMFANRIRKNKKRLGKWVKRENIECYRLYDADMPEYAVAVDVYANHLHVAEYAAPKGVDEVDADRRLKEVASALPQATGVVASNIVYKRRTRQRGAKQYEKEDNRGELITVREGNAKLLVNLTDYLDTGLFLDHRPLRLRLAQESSGKDFLNLFCYTGTATVHAALGGANSTTSVDLSNTYLKWLRKNLAINGQDTTDHEIIQGDCSNWLKDCGKQFDLVLLDPPSFSNSKRMQASFDVKRDHGELISDAMNVLRPGGVLYFSNNRRGFALDEDVAERFDCVDISRETLDQDFGKGSRIHQCWSIRHRDG